MSYRAFAQRAVAVALIAACWISLLESATGQTAIRKSAKTATAQARLLAGSSHFCADCVRSNLSYLAGPALHGRGSGTEDEHHAAQFIARRLKQYGLVPAAENGHYIQTATLRSRTVTKAPVLSFDSGDSASPLRSSGHTAKRWSSSRFPSRRSPGRYRSWT